MRGDKNNMHTASILNFNMRLSKIMRISTFKYYMTIFYTLFIRRTLLLGRMKNDLANIIFKDITSEFKQLLLKQMRSEVRVLNS